MDAIYNKKLPAKGVKFEPIDLSLSGVKSRIDSYVTERDRAKKTDKVVTDLKAEEIEFKGCTVCRKLSDGSGTMMNCNSCHSLWPRYCGRPCQVAHWPNHKGVCTYEYVPPPHDAKTVYKYDSVSGLIGSLIANVDNAWDKFPSKKLLAFTNRTIHLRPTNSKPPGAGMNKSGAPVALEDGVFATTSIPLHFIVDWSRNIPGTLPGLQRLFDAPFPVPLEEKKSEPVAPSPTSWLYLPDRRTKDYGGDQSTPGAIQYKYPISHVTTGHLLLPCSNLPSDCSSHSHPARAGCIFASILERATIDPLLVAFLGEYVHVRYSNTMANDTPPKTPVVQPGVSFATSFFDPVYIAKWRRFFPGPDGLAAFNCIVDVPIEQDEKKEKNEIPVVTTYPGEWVYLNQECGECTEKLIGFEIPLAQGEDSKTSRYFMATVCAGNHRNLCFRRNASKRHRARVNLEVDLSDPMHRFIVDRLPPQPDQSARKLFAAKATTTSRSPPFVSNMCSEIVTHPPSAGNSDSKRASLISDIKGVLTEWKKAGGLSALPESRAILLVNQIVSYLEMLDYYRTDGLPYESELIDGLTAKAILTKLQKIRPSGNVSEASAERMLAVVQSVLSRIEQREMKKTEREKETKTKTPA